MKNPSLKDKFKNNIKFVKPLYKKIKSNRTGSKKTKFSIIDLDNRKPDGNEIYVKRDILNIKDVNYDNILTIKNKDTNTLPGACEVSDIVVNSTKKVKLKEVRTSNKPIGHEVGNMINENANELDNEIENRVIDKSVQANNELKTIIINKAKIEICEIEQVNLLLHFKVTDTWLRVYPAPQYPKEAVTSIIFKCLLCQLGIAMFLIFWTILWVFIINSFEEPHEVEVSLQFEKEQNQLVIELATELRQITPLSPKWKNAIERRMEDERRLTMLAVGQGAKLHPGQFWDLSGTFLFTVYVMTALGFGAPVPQTLWGRTSSLVYAILAVPTHIYLMVNASTCIVYNVDRCIRRLRRNDKNNRNNKAENPHRSGNIQRPNKIICNKISRLLKVLCAGRGVPLAAAFYYTSGAIVFGVLRGKTGLEVVLFPLGFTTTGGLEQVDGHVRIFYGLYVEGAMSLLACALATLRRHSSDAANSVAEYYRLFATAKI
ncbi:uncharacterized protein LOC113509426 [Galleria mellonella]|uniref:Uncharacterized protein LOC113509426 n=1 Tax=Galleria mellonella TaxID=7137 RepID=A0ABM3MEW1_GALME|nr:uncharacterized protein LOC113509426 [Galleria mellonella]